MANPSFNGDGNLDLINFYIKSSGGTANNTKLQYYIDSTYRSMLLDLWAYTGGVAPTTTDTLKDIEAKKAACAYIRDNRGPTDAAPRTYEQRPLICREAEEQWALWIQTTYHMDDKPTENPVDVTQDERDF